MKMQSLGKLRTIIEQLRDPKTGCPWDRVQTHASLTEYVIEEAYEVVEAIRQTPETLEEELGDLLLQIFLHAQIGSENGEFSIESIAKKLCEKLIRRHPHVFADAVANSPEDVKKTWDAVKREERGETKSDSSLLDSVPTFLPALTESSKIGKKVAPKNFDWDTAEEVLHKVQEELDELRDELEQKEMNPSRIEEELGDLLFSVSQLARKLNYDPEITLKAANGKFRRRFKKLENTAQERFPDSPLENIGREHLEKLWEDLKKTE